MGDKWYTILSGPLGPAFQFFMDYVNVTTNQLLKVIFLGLTSLFTPSILAVNVFLLIYLFWYIKNDWQKHLLFIIVGKMVGMYVVLFIMKSLHDRQEMLVLPIIEGIIYGIITVQGIKLAIRGKKKRDTWMKSLGLGGMMSFLLGPTVYILLRTAPYVSEINMHSFSFIYPSFFAIVSSAIFLCLAAFLYAFEIDKHIIKTNETTSINTSWVFFLLFGLNGIVFTLL